MLGRYLSFLALAIFLLMCFSMSYTKYQNHIVFKVDIYKNAKCTDKPAPITIDTSKPCNSYSYVDSKGATITGSQNHVRCYKDKIVSDKYPFSGKCVASESVYQGKQIIQKDHSVPVGACQEAASHDGPVYEKLSGYTYPGNVNCTKS